MIYKELQDPAFLAEHYTAQRKPCRVIASMLGCNVESVRLAIKRHGLTPHSWRRPSPDRSHDQAIVHMYVTEGLTSREIADKFDCCERYVSARLRSLGVSTKRSKKMDLKRDLTGAIIGRLTVRCRADGTDNRWECDCRCGTSIVTSARNLLREHGSRSCGCMKAGNDWEVITPFVWGVIAAKARTRNIDFSLTREYGESLFKQQQGVCALSGISLRFARRRRTRDTTASLDRIDSRVGYAVGNVQWVDKRINMMKQTLSSSEFVALCRAVSEHNQ